MSWTVGDRVHVTVTTSYTNPGPATIVGIDRVKSLPIRVTLDNEHEPFDVMDVHDDEIVSLAPRDQQEPTT